MIIVIEAHGSVEEVCKRIETAATENKFGVSGIVNIRANMSAKGVELGRECRVVELCKASHAKAVLDVDMRISTALPCRISVYEDAGKVWIATIKPSELLGMFGKPELDTVAQEVEETMEKIMQESVF